MNDFTIIFECEAGSHLYGTAIETSDIDYRGVAIEPINCLLGLHSFEQFEDPKGDRVIYGLRKFANLALGQNPNIVELFYVPDAFSITSCPEWKILTNIRKSFLSKGIAKTFVGYARSQAKRMETHYRWMKDAPPEKPNPTDYGMIFREDGTPEWMEINNKNEYLNRLKTYQQYLNWLSTRNPARHELEERFGFDTKNGMHLVRLLQEGEELLRTGYLTLPRPNAKELLDIRAGSMGYYELINYLDAKEIELNRLADTCSLPSKPNTNEVEQEIMYIHKEHLRKEIAWDV